MACQDCGSSDINLCQCDDGKNSYTISTTNTTIANPMTIAVSNVGQNTGAWAKVGQVVFIENYGYYKCTASTSTSITVAFPPSPFVGGATYSLGSVDYDNAGTIPSGTKISPGGVKGATGTIGNNGTTIITAQYVNNPNINQIGSYADFAAISLNAGTLINNGDSLEITARFFYQQNSAGSNYGRVKIKLVENLNTVELLLTPTILGSQNYLTLIPGYDYAEVKIVATKAGATTVSFAYKFDIGLTTDFTNAEYYLSPSSQLTAGGQQNAVSTVTWANQVDILIQGEVDNVADYVKLGYYEIDFKKQY